MNPSLDTPLSRDELDELDNFLQQVEGLEEVMDFSTLDGFFTAILCGPKAIMPSEWMRWVWDAESGEESISFKSQVQAQRVIGLLMRYMNDIATTLNSEPQYYEPQLMENPNNGDPIPILDDWCWGFMKGVNLDNSGWLPVTAGQPDWLSTIQLYGTEEGWRELEKKNLSLEAHKVLAEGLGDSVRNIYALFLAQRLHQAEAGQLPGIVRREPIRNPGKVGRNEPCPCGSGKKFKQCHGAADKLH